MLRKKKVVILLIGLGLLVVVFLWYGNRVAQERENYLRFKAAYAADMHFAVRGGERESAYLIFRANRSNPNEGNFRDVVFVLSEEEAAQFDEDILVAWPQNEFSPRGDIGPIRGTQQRLEQLMLRARSRNPDIDFRDYGLPENEITIVDSVENWEIVSEIFMKYM